MSCFGASIASVMSRPGEEDIPRVVKLLLSWLNKRATMLEGLFHVSAGVKELSALKSQFDSVGGPVGLDSCDPHLVAGVLKAYFIELPEPLLTHDLYQSFVDAADAPDCVSKLREICDRLPRCNKLIAGCLFLFLNNVSRQSSENKTSTSNLAIVFGQILLQPKVESLESLVRHSSKINHIVKTIIENYHAILPKDREEEQLITNLIGGMESQSDAANENIEILHLSPDQQKLRNIKLTVDEAINIILERLNAMSTELENTTSLDDTVDIAKRIRTAKRILFGSSPSVN
eukprot:TRINITY_DN1656_c0_g1_i1.p1 TRINITY_DN1656_c0_g1~~TRINITY_DN1656_c0_g1_i1.p1  ORF type:complete len:305 (+),score=147.68 TRINITY_DN1656_c0_g1_i1:50-916(+)